VDAREAHVGEPVAVPEVHLVLVGLGEEGAVELLAPLMVEGSTALGSHDRLRDRLDVVGAVTVDGDDEVGPVGIVQATDPVLGGARAHVAQPGRPGDHAGAELGRESAQG